MKQVLYAFFITISTLGFAQTHEALKWSQDFNQTLKEAKKNKKPIIMYFSGSDWCAPCKSLDKDFFHSEAFIKEADELNLVLVDIPRRVDIISEEQLLINKELLKKYNKKQSFPLVLFMSYKGKIKNKISGYSFLRDTSKHFEYLHKLSK